MDASGSYLPVFHSREAERLVFEAYDAIMDMWPVPYEELYVSTQFGHTHVVVSGLKDGPPIVLLHAMFATASSWYKVVGDLAADHRVYAVDILGEANKSRPTKSMKTLDDYCSWFTEVIDSLGVDHFILVGNSFGGFVATWFAMQILERVKGLVLIGPGATVHSMWPFYLHMFIPKALSMLMSWFPFKERIIEHGITWVRAGLPADVAWEELFRRVMLHGTSTNQVFPRVYTREEFARITCPTTLIVGDHERIYSARQAERSARLLMPTMKISILQGANHMAGLTQPHAVARVITSTK